MEKLWKSYGISFPGICTNPECSRLNIEYMMLLLLLLLLLLFFFFFVFVSLFFVVGINNNSGSIPTSY